MTQQMHLLVLKETGHILAAVAQTISAEDPSPEALAGTDLPVMMPRWEGSTEGPISTLVPVPLLEVKSVAYDPAIVAEPQAYVVDEGRVAAVPRATAIPLAELKAGHVKVDQGTPGVPVVVILAEHDEPTNEHRAQSGQFTPTSDAVLALAVLPGESPAAITVGKHYDVLVAHGGRRLEWTIDKVAT
jgi:hypothetical protein